MLKLRFGKPTLFHQEYARFQSCFVGLYFHCILCTAPGEHVGEHVAGHRGGRFSIQKGRPGRPVLLPPAAPPSRQLESKDGGSNAKRACKPHCFCWKTNTFRNAPLQRKLPLLLIATFLIGKVMFLHVTPVAAQARDMSGWKGHVAGGEDLSLS